MAPQTLKTHATTLVGDRVVLRPMTEDDWDLILAINNDPEIGYFTEEDEWAPYTLEQLQRIYRSISQQAHMFVIEYEGRAIGECWLQRMNLPRLIDRFPGRDLRRIDLAIGDKHLWGQGLGTEVLRLLVRFAFEQEGAEIVFGVDVGGYNSGSRRAFEKAGFNVLQRIPRPGNPKAEVGYDLVLTREQYLRFL
ncbi:MAG TPA: GNAT family N-acetyltransferase [Chloroflexota bacterium]|nr:GNAT family N-acetyltransferase [Chloroflexota bacterium]